MSSEKTTMLLSERYTPLGQAPYQHLQRRLAGIRLIGPQSTASDIKDAFFDIQSFGVPTEADRIAWEALRRTDQRTVIDFLMYEVPQPDIEGLMAALAGLEMPYSPVDFRRFAAGLSDFSIVRPSTVAPAVEPPLLSLPEGAIADTLVSIEDLEIDFFTILEDAND